MYVDSPTIRWIWWRSSHDQLILGYPKPERIIFEIPFREKKVKIFYSSSITPRTFKETVQKFHCKLCSPCITFYKFFGCKTKPIVFEMLASEMKTYNGGYSSGNLDRTATVGVRHRRALHEVHGGGQYCVVKLTKHPAAPLGLAVRAHPQLARVAQHILLPLCLILQVHPILCKTNTFSSLFT